MKTLFSATLSTVPFVSHTDGNRLAMADNFLKQSLVCVNPEIPRLTTKYLKLITTQSSFMKRVTSPIKILYVDDEVIVYSADGRSYMTRLPNSFWRPAVQQELQSGELLYSHEAVKLDRYCSGVNLNVVFAPYYGWNYEDAIVVTEQGAKKLSTRHILEWMIIVSPNEVVLKHPTVGKFYKQGEVFFEAIQEPRNLVNILCAGVERDIRYTPADLQIDRVLTYYRSEDVLKKHKSSKEFLNWVRAHNKTKSLKQSLSFDKELMKICALYYPENYELVGHPDAITIRIQAHCIKEFKVGDKLGNRYGNKGVCSIIVENDRVRSTDGWVPDLVLNPLGVVSRMNVGQILEMHMSQVVSTVESLVLRAGERKEYEKMLLLLKTFQEDTESTIPYLQECSSSKEIYELIAQYGLFLELPLYTKNMHIKVRDLCEKYGVPLKKQFKFFTNGMYGYGQMYWMPLVHTVESKFSSRSDGPYHSKTLQPIATESVDSGQRIGEMEIHALLAYGAVNNIIEVLGLKADDIISKEVLLSHVIRTGRTLEYPESYTTNHILHHYLYSLGIFTSTSQDLIIADTELEKRRSLLESD